MRATPLRVAALTAGALLPGACAALRAPPPANA